MTAYYYQCSIGALMDFLSETLYEETCNTDYLMIDETCEIVAVKDKEGNKSFKKKYLWAFFSKMKKWVSYVYEHGSRDRDVVLKPLKNFCGCISTDGYVAYSIFDDAEKYPNIMHIGCWTHARRLFVEAYETDKINCGAVINDIGELVVAVDVIPEKVEKINNRISPIQDENIEKYFAEKKLNLTATLDGASGL